MSRPDGSARTIVVTGGAGFIGSMLVRHIIRATRDRVVNLDKLTYAGNPESVADVAADARYRLEQVDICDAHAVARVFGEYQPDIVIHLAAESHVDRSIDGPAAFIQTNIVGTYTLLEAARAHWLGLDAKRRDGFRFHHVSTDEVYGDLHATDNPFTEHVPYAPSSPYSASKASSDHLVRAWSRTYGLPALITNCSNNYGPHQFPEKLIPLMILNAVRGKPLPVYGDGGQARDWLFVDDHARALYLVASTAAPGATYNIGGHNERRNLEVVHAVCALLEELAPTKPVGVARYTDLITRVKDRPGHDRRYAIDAGRIERELGWAPTETFETGLRKTVAWYLANPGWCGRVLDGSYRRERLRA